jgi:hypothetical protein
MMVGAATEYGCAWPTPPSFAAALSPARLANVARAAARLYVTGMVVLVVAMTAHVVTSGDALGVLGSPLPSAAVNLACAMAVASSVKDLCGDNSYSVSQDYACLAYVSAVVGYVAIAGFLEFAAAVQPRREVGPSPTSRWKMLYTTETGKGIFDLNQRLACALLLATTMHCWKT